MYDLERSHCPRQASSVRLTWLQPDHPEPEYKPYVMPKCLKTHEWRGIRISILSRPSVKERRYLGIEMLHSDPAAISRPDCFCGNQDIGVATQVLTSRKRMHAGMSFALLQRD